MSVCSSPTHPLFHDPRIRRRFISSHQLVQEAPAQSVVVKAKVAQQKIVILFTISIQTQL